MIRLATQITMVFLFSLLLNSCSSTNYAVGNSPRNHPFSKESLTKLEGEYKVPIESSLFKRFQIDTILRPIKESSVQLRVLDERNIELTLYTEGLEIGKLNYKGRCQGGYFRLKQKDRAEMLFGPLFWIVAGSKDYIGLNQEKDLLLEERDAGGVALILILPIMAAGGGDTITEYERIE